jgi:hypothetical protein
MTLRLHSSMLWINLFLTASSFSLVGFIKECTTCCCHTFHLHFNPLKKEHNIMIQTLIYLITESSQLDNKIHYNKYVTVVISWFIKWTTCKTTVSQYMLCTTALQNCHSLNLFCKSLTPLFNNLIYNKYRIHLYIFKATKMAWIHEHFYLKFHTKKKKWRIYKTLTYTS